ncbi:MAG: phosphoenolpyruvate hydrolase family protein [Pirellulales bacterium]|nr:phosphoenolpyruvate hydrolase family protein [Pirellulales bacterium]
MIISRDESLKRLRERIEQKVPIVGGGAGTGISAKFEEAGGIDLIIIYNSGRFRMAGRGSLAGLMPYGDANGIVIEMASEVLTVVQDTPVLAGVCASDPFRIIDKFLDEVKSVGFSGIQNFPTVGLIDGQFRANLEETGMGYDKEVELVRLARQKDLLTTPYAFNTGEAEKMAAAGADVIVAHMGLTTKGSIGAESGRTLDDSVRDVQAISDAAHGVSKDVIVLCHGGPIAMPEDAEYVLQRTKNVDGFYGASSMERLPVETALTTQTEAFKAIRF